MNSILLHLFNSILKWGLDVIEINRNKKEYRIEDLNVSPFFVLLNHSYSNQL